MFPIGLLQTLEGLIHLAKARVDRRQIIGLDISFIRHLFQLCQHLLCFVSLSRVSINVSETCQGLRAVSRESYRFLKFGYRLRRSSFTFICQPEIEEGWDIVRVEFERLLELFYRL